VRWLVADFMLRSTNLFLGNGLGQFRSFVTDKGPKHFAGSPLQRREESGANSLCRRRDGVN